MVSASSSARSPKRRVSRRRDGVRCGHSAYTSENSRARHDRHRQIIARCDSAPGESAGNEIWSSCSAATAVPRASHFVAIDRWWLIERWWLRDADIIGRVFATCEGHSRSGGFEKKEWFRRRDLSRIDRPVASLISPIYKLPNKNSLL